MAAAAASAAPKMEYRLLGNSGLKVSVLSFGSWVTFKAQVNAPSAFELMSAAYKSGINFFDNAETYANGEAEKIMGEAIAQGVAEKVWERDDLVISTKIFFGYGKNGPNSKGLSRKHIVEGMKASLKRLGLDYVDLAFCHRPDPLTPIEEIVRAWNYVIDQGWAFYWGTSEWNAQQITEAIETANKLGLIAPIYDQPEYNLFERSKVEIDYLPLYKNYGYGLTTWSPLASGILTGKYSGGSVPEGSRLSLPDYKWLADIKLGPNKHQIELADKLKQIADKIGASLAQLSIAWCVYNKHVSTVILGATSIQQLNDNLASLAIVPKLTPEIIQEIEDAIKTKPEPDRIAQQVARLRSLI